MANITRKTPLQDPGRNILSPRHGDTRSPQACTVPAGWLPVSNDSHNTDMGMTATEHNVHNKKEYVVIMPGKVVAYTREGNVNSNALNQLNKGQIGRLVPAGIRKAWAAAGNSDVVLAYTSVDVDEKIEDLGTGAPVAAAKTYTKTQLTAALKARGFLTSAETLEAFISYPVGVASNPVYAWAGGDGTQVDQLRYESYRLQNQAAFWTGEDNTLKLPVMPYAEQSEEVPAITTVYSAFSEITGGTPVWATGNGGQLSSVVADSVTGASLKAKRYSGLTNTNYVALILGTKGVEHDALLHPITITSSGTDITSTVLKAEKTSPQALSRAGDYFVDRDLGIIFFYENGGNALPASLTAADVITFSANTTHTETARRNAVCFAGTCYPGALVTYNKNSDFMMATPRPAETSVTATSGTNSSNANNAATVTATAYVAPTAYTPPQEIIGRSYSVERGPFTDLTLARTSHDPLNGFPLQDASPGSATGGWDALTWDAQAGRLQVIVRVLL